MRSALFVLITWLVVAQAAMADADINPDTGKPWPKNDCAISAKPAECLFSGAKFVTLYCDTARYATEMEFSMGSRDYGSVLSANSQCVRWAEDHQDPAYLELVKRYKRDKEKVALIKDYYAAWLASVRRTAVEPGESSAAHQMRVGQAKRTVEEKQARLELELK